MSTAGWFQPGAAGQMPDGRVFCFAHAGGNPRSFLPWQSLVGPSVEIVPVYLPGRAHRDEEPPPTSLTGLADDVTEAVAGRADIPFHLFGHSFGALLAFEVARRLRHVGTLRALVASGCSAPSLQPSAQVVRAAEVDGREFAEIVNSYGGVPPEIVADEELHHLLFPSLKADVKLLAGYRYQPAAPLFTDLVLINGRDDPHIAPESLEPWADECATAPEQRWSDGDHFYFTQRPGAVVDVFRRLVQNPRHALGVEDHVELI
jgi:surfactin synthase thioesterase subunit